MTLKQWLLKYIGPEGLITVRTRAKNTAEARRNATILLESRGHAEGAVFIRIDEVLDG